MIDRLPMPTFAREASVDFAQEQPTEDRRYAATLSSQEAVAQRYYPKVGGGVELVEEVLDHSPKAVRMDRIRRHGPVFIEHDRNRLIGRIDDPHLDGTELKGTLVFADTPEASAEVGLIDGQFRKGVSISYRVHAARQIPSAGTKKRILATDWEPIEASTTAMPEDINGMIHGARSSSADNLATIEYDDMTDEEQSTNMPNQSAAVTATTDTPPPQAPDLHIVREEIRAAELERIDSLTKLGILHNHEDLARDYIKDGKSPRELIVELGSRKATQMRRAGQRVDASTAVNSANLGMSRTEQQRYSFGRAVAAICLGHESAKMREAAAFEYECSRAVADKLNIEPEGILVPNEMLMRDGLANQPGENAELVETVKQGFVAPLRNRSIIMQMGSTTLTGLVGNVSIPRQTTDAIAYWVAEDGTSTKSSVLTDEINLTPHTATAEVVYGKQLLAQSENPSVSEMYRNSVQSQLALAFDQAALIGTGTSNQPAGIITGATALPDYPLGGNPDWGDIVGLETAVASANADINRIGYVMAAAGRGVLKSTPKFASGDTPIWEPNNTVNGYMPGVSNQCPADHYFFGSFESLIMAQWGAMDLTSDPFTLASTRKVKLYAHIFVDIGLQHDESFSYIKESAT